MSRKPSKSDLETDIVRYQKFEVKVPVYRDRDSGNLYFVDQEGHVLDQYVQVVDHGGIPIIQKRRSKAEKFLRLVSNIIAALDPSRLELPLGIAKKLFDLSERDVNNARVILNALDDLDDGLFREGALALIDHFGPVEMQGVLEAWVDDPKGMLKSEIEEKIRKLLPTPIG